MNIFKTTFVLLLLLVSSINSFSKSHIELNFPGAENRKATVWVYKDLISLERQVVSEIIIDKKGNFSFDTYNSQVQKYFIEIRYFRVSFYIEPSTDYKIQFDKVDFNNREYYPKNMVGYLIPNYEIIEPSAPEFNSELDSLNIIFDDFIDKNHLRLRMGNKSWQLVDSLEMEVNTYLKKHTDKDLKSNAAIQIAQFRMLSNQYGRDYIVKTYFRPKDIAYHNIAYMSFFRSFWTKYIGTSLKRDLRNKLDSVINEERSYQALSALLANDSLLTDPALKKLVILRNIPQLYKMDKFDKQAVINILYDISASKYSKEHQHIAVNLRKKIEDLNTGAKAPDFSFIDYKGDTISLEKQQGMYIYIQVFTDECIECLSQLKVTKELYDKFDDIITFVHISLDRKEEDMLNVIKDEDYKWHFVFLEDNYKFLQDYDISAFPRAILISQEGEFIKWNAPLPSQYFEDYFLKYLNDKKGNLQLENPRYRGYRKKN